MNTEAIDLQQYHTMSQSNVAPRSGVASNLSFPTTGGKRRVHAEGVTMLEKKLQAREEELKMQSMENRIRRLEFEEQRARKMEQLANKRAENMIEARKRHYTDLLQKKNFLLNKQLDENRQRQLNI